MSWQVGILIAIAIVGLPGWVIWLGRLHRGQPGLSPRLPNDSGRGLGLAEVGLLFLLPLIGAAVGLEVSRASSSSPALVAVVEPGGGEEREAVREVQTGDAVVAWSALGRLAGLALALAMIGIRKPALGLRSVGWDFSHWRRDLLLGTVGFAMVVPPILCLHNLLGWLVPYEHETLNTLGAAEGVGLILALWLSAVIAAPISEEFFYRGAFQGWLQHFPGAEGGNLSRWILGEPLREEAALEGGPPVGAGSWMPIVISAGLFGLMHWGQGPAPVSLFLLGVALGYLFRQTGSVLPCIVVHFLLNAMTMALATFAAAV